MREQVGCMMKRRTEIFMNSKLTNSRNIFRTCVGRCINTYALARISQRMRRDAFSRIASAPNGISPGMAREDSIRMNERTSGRFRLGSLVLRINQLCLSVFHRAGGELISFPLNTNFFSGRKPISIKMARAFRILPDYKRLPPLSPADRAFTNSLFDRPRALTPPSPLPHSSFPPPLAPLRRIVPFFPRSASIGCGCSCIERLDRRIVNTELVWSEFWRDRPLALSLDTPLISLPFILCFALLTSESRISDKYNVDYFSMRPVKMYLDRIRWTIYPRNALFLHLCNNTTI